MATKKSTAKVTTISNDNVSKMIGKILPNYQDNDDFIDIVQWNLRWFNSQEPKRENAIFKILSVLNSDIFVFQEVADGSLDNIAARLTKAGLGYYEVAYGTTGGQQRIAFMYDTEWVRRKDDVNELFGKKNVTTPSGKDVFPRLPLWSYFYCKSTVSHKRGFDFQLIGLHLKSMMDLQGNNEDELQRTLACAKLMDWLEKDGNSFDADSIMLGDWNEPPSAKAWASARALEKDKRVKFESINDNSDFSHLYYINKDHIASRLDLRLATTALAKNLNQDNLKRSTVRWVTLDNLIGADPSASEIRAYIKEIGKEVSDHMPVLTRFGKTKKK